MNQDGDAPEGQKGATRLADCDSGLQPQSSGLYPGIHGILDNYMYFYLALIRIMLRKPVFRFYT